MSLRVDKDNIYFVLPESRYTVSNRIDKYMEEDFTLFIKTKIITDNLETEKEAFLIARNGMHSGISVYKDAFDKNVELPKSYEQFSFLGKKTLPVIHENLSREQILKFRDNAFIEYHSNKDFQDKIVSLYGEKALNSIKKMLEINLERE